MQNLAALINHLSRRPPWLQATKKGPRNTRTFPWQVYLKLEVELNT